MEDEGGHWLVAADTILLYIAEGFSGGVEYLDIEKGKSGRMTNAIFYFGSIFLDFPMREMAVVARDFVVAGNDPAVETLTHDVAVQTDLRRIR